MRTAMMRSLLQCVHASRAHAVDTTRCRCDYASILRHARARTLHHDCASIRGCARVHVLRHGRERFHGYVRDYDHIGAYFRGVELAHDVDCVYVNAHS